MADDNALSVGSTVPGHYGAESTSVTLCETKFVGAWNVQGNAQGQRFIDEVRWLFNASLATTPNTVLRGDKITSFWIGPTSWLLVTSSEDAMGDFDSRRDALNNAGGALFDVSASRVAWTIAGARAASVLAKSCPLDFHQRTFAEGTCAQSVLGHVNALFYRRATYAFTVLVARSFARDVWRSLCASSAQYGYEVLPPRDF